MTVKEVSRLTGVSVRTLHYYDEKGLLRPRRAGESGYRLYDSADLERLQMILLFRALEFPLKEIKEILDNPGFDRTRALEQQIQLLTLRKEHIQNLIDFTRGIQLMGVKNLDFSAFDTRKIDDYAAQAKAAWGKTDAYRECEEKAQQRTEEEEKQLAADTMEIFQRFGALRALPAANARVRAQVEQLRAFITAHFYTCTPQLLRGLGKLYAGGGCLTERIDEAGGCGTGAFVRAAIEAYCATLPMNDE